MWWDEQQQEKILSADTLNRVRHLHALAQERGQTLAQMALAWNLRSSAVTGVLIGASKVEQLVENVAALQNLTFSEQELQRIDEITLS